MLLLGKGADSWSPGLPVGWHSSVSLHHPYANTVRGRPLYEGSPLGFPHGRDDHCPVCWSLASGFAPARRPSLPCSGGFDALRIGLGMRCLTRHVRARFPDASEQSNREGAECRFYALDGVPPQTPQVGRF